MHKSGLILLCLYAFCAKAQNLFPNPGFEIYDQCPDYTSQINRCSDWDSAIGTADFYHCGYYAPSTIGPYGIPRTGDGVIGLICSPPSVFNPGAMWYGETFKGMLLQTLQPGAVYRVSSHWLFTTTNMPPPASFCYSLGFYFYKSNHPPSAPLSGCAAFRPQVQIDPSQVALSAYTGFTVDFTADSCYDAVMIGIFCNDSTETLACMQVADADYFDVDDISLTKIAEPPFTFSGFEAGSLELCKGECNHFTDTSSANRYARTWLFDGAIPALSSNPSPQQICYPDTGKFDVTLITRYECGSDTLVKKEYISVLEKPEIHISADSSVLCYGQIKALQASSNDPFTWSTGETTATIYIQFPGTYYAYAENNCGAAADTLQINYESCPCYLWLPNAFSPNRDGKNENYLQKSECNFKSYRMNIYNRWGQRVFSSQVPHEGWDGRYRGKDAPEGLYVVTLHYEAYDQNRLIEKDVRQVVHLLR